MPVAVGVDLGSTHCNVGVWHQGRPEVIANHHGLRSTPTMVAFTDSEVLVGEAALSQMPKNVANTVTGFKWMVGQNHDQMEPHIKAMLESSPFRCSVDSKGEARVTVKHKGEEKVVGAETLCRYLFEHLKDIAEAFAGEPVGRCVISVPTGFSPEQREALRTVGKQAGLPFSLVVSDSVAAAIAYGLDRPDHEMVLTSRDGGEFKPKRNIVVVDWGGGGVEATVLKRTDGVLSIVGKASDASAGGGVFTERLVAFCAKDFKRRTGGLDIFESKRSVLKVTRACEEAVRTLSASAQADVYIEAAHEGCDMNVKISRTRFEDLCFDLYKAAGGVISKALAEAGMATDAVDTVLLAGGITQMPKVSSSVKATFPAGTHFGAGLFPDEAVAIGATTQAFLLQEHGSFVAPGAPPLPVAVRTCPASLGVRCGGSGGNVAEDTAVAIISKGCILPAQGNTTVKLGGGGVGGPATEAYLEVVEIGQAEGEEGTQTARLLGTLAFDETAVPADGSAEVEVKVGFTLRSEGVLKIEAVTPGGVSKELVIGHDGTETS
ncbi:unnamed protein product [Ectocarpus sp. 12 AP-2014]